MNVKKVQKRGESFVVTLPKKQATELANRMWMNKWGTVFTHESPLFGKRYSFVHLTEWQMQQVEELRKWLI